MSPQVQEPKPCAKTMAFIYDYYKEWVSINNIQQAKYTKKESDTVRVNNLLFFPPVRK